MISRVTMTALPMHAILISDIISTIKQYFLLPNWFQRQSFCVLLACWPHLCFAIHGLWHVTGPWLFVSWSAFSRNPNGVDYESNNFQMTYIFFNQLIFLWILSCNLSISGVTQCWKSIYRRKLGPGIVTAWQRDSAVSGVPCSRYDVMIAKNSINVSYNYK